MKSPLDHSYMFKPNLIIWEPNVNDDIWDEYNFEETYGLDMRLFDRTEECKMPVLVDDSLNKIIF